MVLMVLKITLLASQKEESSWTYYLCLLDLIILFNAPLFFVTIFAKKIIQLAILHVNHYVGS
jgi:hypothetical protein